MNCYICGSEQIRLLRVVQGFAIFHCKSCRLSWVPDVSLQTVQDYYRQGYFTTRCRISGYKDYLADELLLRRNARRLLNAARSRFDAGEKPRVLDVGCAHGFLLDEARKMGFEGYGIELSPEGVRYANDVLHLNVRQGTLRAQEFQRGTFDAVFVVGTIEHLTDPAEVLREIHCILKDGGIVVITTINTGGLFPFFSWKPPEHLYYFNARNLRLLLEGMSFSECRAHMYWAYYRLSDLLYRFGQFSSLPVIDKISHLLEKKKHCDQYLKIPTNEMLVTAVKKGDHLTHRV